MAGNNSPLVTLTNRQGVETKYPFLSVIRFGNRGKGEIKADAYDGPVRVKFADSRIVAAAIHDGLGIQTETVLTVEDKVLTFKPFLLRKDEWFDVQVITDGRPELPELKVRVAGHKAEVGEMTRKRYEFWQLVQWVAAAMAVTMLIMIAVAGSAGVTGVNAGAFWVSIAVLGIANYFKAKQPKWKNETNERSLWR